MDTTHFSDSPALSPQTGLSTPSVPPLHLQGSFSIQELVTQWRASGTQQPQVLFDFPQLRYEHQLAWEQKYAIPVEEPRVVSPTPLELPQLPPLLPAQALPAPVSGTDRDIHLTQLQLRAEAPLPPTPEVIVLPAESGNTELWNQETFQQVPASTLRPSWKLPSIAWPEISLPNLQVHWLQVASNFALSSAVALTLLFAGPIVVLETQSLITRALQTLKPTPADPAVLPTVVTPSPDPIVTSAEDVFSIRVPSLNIASTVVPNVDASDEKQYTAALKEGIAHAKGSGLPDQLEENKTIYLFAHSTDAPWNILRYNAQFYALKDAEIGSKITIRFWGKDFTYTIQEKHIIEADDVSYMQPQTETEKLILQTCYPPGTAEKRLVVVAVPEI